MQKQSISAVILGLMEARLQGYTPTSQDIFSQSQRGLQAEIEHQQLTRLLTTARSLVEGMRGL